MSFRTWVGPNSPDLPLYFDYGSFEHTDLADLAEDMNWRMPAKLYFDPAFKAEVGELLFILREEHAMGTDDFWHIAEMGEDMKSKDGVWHPSEKEVEDMLGIKIEMREKEIA